MSEQPATLVKAKASKDRKRELDRKAQRSARDRTKRRIAQLETTVAHLQQTDGDGRTVSLTEHLSQVMRERDTLLDCLESLGTTIRGHLEKNPASKERSPHILGKEDRAQPSRKAQVSEVQPSPEAQEKLYNLRTETNNRIFPNIVDTPPRSVSSLEACNQAGTHTSINDSIDITDRMLSIGASTVDEDLDHTHDTGVLQPRLSGFGTIWPASIPSSSEIDIWHMLESMLEEARIVSQASLVWNTLAWEDCLIRAVLNGWHSIEDSEPMPVACHIARTLDDMCVNNCKPIDRLAILSLYCTMVMNIQDDERRSFLPRWLQPRPSQSLPHPIVIDYMFWPGARERMVFSHEIYSTNEFCVSCFLHTKISWPFDFRDAYVCNFRTGRFQLSPHFWQSIQDISSWDVADGFFEQYPEFQDDIKGYNGLGLL